MSQITLNADNVHDMPDGKYLGLFHNGLIIIDDAKDATMAYAFASDKLMVAQDGHAAPPIKVLVTIEGKKLKATARI